MRFLFVIVLALFFVVSLSILAKASMVTQGQLHTMILGGMK